MDVPRTNINYILPENQVNKSSRDKDKNGKRRSFHDNEKDLAIEHQQDVKNIFLNSYLEESDILVISTIDWLRTWRPLVH